MSNKTRLDVLLVEQGLVESRQKAQAVIMAGSVFVDGQRVDKPGTAVPNTAAIQVRGHALPYVSRGGLKLEKAMQTFPLTLDGKVCADIGASTGGFTDCMLQHGAAKVWAVDVGRDQLDESLRRDPRVVSMEQTDIRTADLPQVDFIGTDVSFISLKLILPHIYRLLKSGGRAAVLIKPQFEAGRSNLSKKGIVRDEKVRLRIRDEIAEFAQGCGFSVIGTETSPITGGDGNTEYLMCLEKR
mgnify:CR=1 FL=1